MPRIDYLPEDFFGNGHKGLVVDLSDVSKTRAVLPDKFDRAARRILPPDQQGSHKFDLRFLVSDEDFTRLLILFPQDVSYLRAYNRIHRSPLRGNLRAAGRIEIDIYHNNTRRRLNYSLGEGLDFVLPRDNGSFIRNVLPRELGPGFRI